MPSEHTQKEYVYQVDKITFIVWGTSILLSPRSIKKAGNPCVIFC